MNSISKEEYLKLLESIASQQYGSDDEVIVIPEEAWMPSEPAAKERMNKAFTQGVIDVTKFKKNKLQEAIYKYMNIKIGSFLIKINEYHGLPDKNGVGVGMTMDISVVETRYQTPTGNPCHMEYRMDFQKDNRFNGKPWLNYFTHYGKAYNIPTETVIDIIRWMQIIQKLTAFL